MRNEAEILGEFQQQILQVVEESVRCRKTPGQYYWPIAVPYAQQLALQKDAPDLVKRLKNYSHMIPEQTIQQIERIFEDTRIAAEDIARQGHINCISTRYIEFIDGLLSNCFEDLDSAQGEPMEARLEHARNGEAAITSIARMPISSAEDLTERLHQLRKVDEEHLNSIYVRKRYSCWQHVNK